jgi:hypothetical protein
MADIHKYTLAEVLNVVALPNTPQTAISNEGLLFTLQAIDTFTKQPDGSYIRTATVDKFNPTIERQSDGSIKTLPVNGTVPWITPTELSVPIPQPVAHDCNRWFIKLKETNPANNNDIIATDIMDHSLGKLWNKNMPLGPVMGLDEIKRCYDNQSGDKGFTITKPIPFVFPGATFILQNGIPAPAYPTLVGSLVFDTQLKKWGKQAGEFTCLLQFSPINETNNEAIPYTNFGMDSGIVDAADKKIKLFTVNPEEGFMRYGKIALYRLGFTELLEVNINFRTPFTGDITVDGSIDDRNLEPMIQHVESFVNARNCNVKCHVNAMWHTLSISGNFDLQYMEFRGIMAARR